MAGYIAGSKEWYDHVKERILTLGDLMMSPLTTGEEKRKYHVEQTALILGAFKYFETIDYESVIVRLGGDLK